MYEGWPIDLFKFVVFVLIIIANFPFHDILYMIIIFIKTIDNMAERKYDYSATDFVIGQNNEGGKSKVAFQFFLKVFV